MCTVPAHSFCAPTRALLIAAARSMPGVEAVLVSRLSPGITATPLCFLMGFQYAKAMKERTWLVDLFDWDLPSFLGRGRDVMRVSVRVLGPFG